MKPLKKAKSNYEIIDINTEIPNELMPTAAEMYNMLQDHIYLTLAIKQTMNSFMKKCRIPLKEMAKMIHTDEKKLNEKIKNYDWTPEEIYTLMLKSERFKMKAIKPIVQHGINKPSGIVKLLPNKPNKTNHPKDD